MSKRLLFLLSIVSHLQSSTFWQDPVEVASVANSSTIRALTSAMNAAGDAIVIWGTDSNTVSGGTFSSYRLSTQTSWSAPATLAAIAPTASTYRPINVVLDESKIASAVFVTSNSIGLSRATLGGAWDAPVFFSPLGSMVSIQDANISLDSNQVPIALFTQGVNVYYTSFVSGAWQTPVLLASDGAGGYPSNISGSPDGDVVAVWQMNNMMGFSFYEFSTRIDGVWSTPELVAAYFSVFFSAPKIVGGPLNRFLFQAFEVNGAGTAFELEAAQAVNPQISGDWIQTTLGSVSSSDITQSMDLSMNSSGAALSFWRQTSLPTTTLFSNYWDSSATAPDSPLTIASGTSITSLKGVIEKDGIGIAVWKQGTTTQSSNNLNGGAWTTPEDITSEDPTTNSLNRLVTSLGKSVSFVFWIETDGTSSYILSRKHPIIPAPSPPTGGEGKNLANRFATQGYVINWLSWSPSADPDVVSYSIYADSGLTQLLGSVPASSSLAFTTGIVYPYASHSYYVTAIKNEADPSSPLTITIPAYK